jgi:hypothetical protein
MDLDENLDLSRPREKYLTTSADKMRFTNIKRRKKEVSLQLWAVAVGRRVDEP